VEVTVPEKWKQLGGPEKVTADAAGSTLGVPMLTDRRNLNGAHGARSYAGTRFRRVGLVRGSGDDERIPGDLDGEMVALGPTQLGEHRGGKGYPVGCEAATETHMSPPVVMKAPRSMDRPQTGLWSWSNHRCPGGAW
jgi:hypothetical protein